MHRTWKLVRLKRGGEEGVTLEDFVTCQRARFVNMICTQHAYDTLDGSTPIDRQRRSFDRVAGLVSRVYAFADGESARNCFTRIAGLSKNLNDTREEATDFLVQVERTQDLADVVTKSCS